MLSGLHENDQSPFEVHLSNEFQDIEENDRATDLYRALCNTGWIDASGERNSMSWRSAGDVVAEIRNRLFVNLDVDRDLCMHCQQRREEHQLVEGRKISIGDQEIETTRFRCLESRDQQFWPDQRGNEDYLDFYCAGGEGRVANWIEERMKKIGYQLEASDQKA